MIRRLFESPHQGLLWLLCLAMMLGSHPHDWTGDQRIVPSAQSALLAADSVWHPPLSHWTAAGDLVRWPFVVVAGVLAAAIVTICQPASSPLGVDRLCAAIALSLAAVPEDVAAAVALTLLAAGSRGLDGRRRPLSIVLILMSAALALVTTLEFGLIVSAAVCLLLSANYIPQSEHPQGRRWLLGACVVLIVSVLLSVLLHAGFRSAALRPINWIWLQPPAGLMPSLSTSVSTPMGLVVIGLLLPVWCLGWLSLLRTRNSLWSMIFGVACVVLAICCRRYLFLAGLASMLPLLPHANVRWSPSRPRMVISLCLALAAGRAVWLTDWSAMLSSAASPVVQPAEWGIDGTVVLLELDQSSAWHARHDLEALPLLVDDRWDALGAAYTDFAMLRGDLQEVRDHPYVRNDGTWGGYRAWLLEQQPTLLVVDSRSAVTIRALSLSPDWRIMGIDRDFAYFGRANDQGNLRQMQHALQTVINLEWPAQPVGDALDNTFVAANDADDRVLAGALCAMRFPYAGLRFLQGDASFAARRVQAWAAVELAHRVSQHSSSASLLDQSRAAVLARGVLSDFRLQQEERNRMLRGLAALGVTPELAAADDGAESNSEQRLRAALLEGDVSTARAILPEVDQSLRPFYRALIEAPAQPLNIVSQQFQSAISLMDADVPAELKGEAQFYLGCAALEAGDSLTALTAFVESNATAPDSVFREIRNVYLRQLTR